MSEAFSAVLKDCGNRTRNAFRRCLKTRHKCPFRRETRRATPGRQCRSVSDVKHPWRFKRVLEGRRIQDAGREDSDTLDTFDATDLRNIDPGKHTLCAPFSTDASAADASASPAADSLN